MLRYPYGTTTFKAETLGLVSIVQLLKSHLLLYEWLMLFAHLNLCELTLPGSVG